MAQKITATMATLAAAACIVIAVLVWQSTLRDSDAQQQLLLAQQELNRTLLAELKSLQQASSTAAATTAGWAPVKVRLQSEDGDPVAGNVTIQGTAINAGNDNAINVSRTADEAGVADFGLLPFGNYKIEVVRTELDEVHGQSLMLSPDSPSEVSIICPAEPPPAVDVSFAIDVPPPLDTDRLVFMAHFQRPSRTTSSGSWRLMSFSDRFFSVLFDTDGTILGEINQPNEVVGASSEELPGGFFADASGGFVRGGPPRVAVFQSQLVPARTIRSIDRCIGLSVAAKVGNESVDSSTVYLALAPETYTAEVVQSEWFPDTDPDEETMRIAFDLPSSIWDSVVAAFRRSAEVADVTIPEGWQIVKVPANLRSVFGSDSRSRFARGRSLPETLPQLLHVQVWITGRPFSEAALPVGVGEAIRGASISTEDVRDALNDGRKLEVDLLVSSQLAGAIEVARELGVLEAVRLPDEGVDDVDENGVNQQTLETLRKLAAEQATAKDE